MKSQILLITVALMASPLLAQDKLGMHVTPHAVAPLPGEFTSVPKPVLDSIRDLANALRDDFLIVSREEADLVLWVQRRSSRYPSVDRTIVSDFGDRLEVERQTTGVVPIRGVSAVLMIPRTEYQIRFYGAGIWRWRSAAGKLADEIAAWTRQNAAALGAYRGNRERFMRLAGQFKTGNLRTLRNRPFPASGEDR